MTPEKARNVELPLNPIGRHRAVRAMLADVATMGARLEVNPASAIHVPGLEQDAEDGGVILVHTVLPWLRRRTLVQAAQSVQIKQRIEQNL